MHIKINNVSKTIKGIPVLRNVSLDFYSGNIYGIVGRNGSGKTMLLRLLSGLIIPSSGKVYIDEQQLHKHISFPPQCGILIEKPEFLSHLTGFQNLKLLSEIKKQITDSEISYYMELFHLDPKSPKKVSQYSLGMKQKLGIIQAIMENQKLIILDEPFNGLDTSSVSLLQELLIEYRNQGKLIILTSHYKSEIEKLCDFTITISDGCVHF